MRRDELYLNDIIESANPIAAFIDGVDFAAFQESEMMRSAVVQKLAIIGEAAARLSEVVWRAARNRCPVLSAQVAVIVAQEYGGPGA